MEKSFEYPFEEVPIREALTEKELLRYAQAEIAAGPSKPSARVPRAFLARQKRLSSDGTGLPDFEPPDWVRDLIAAKRSPEEMLETLRRRVFAEPRESSLREALIIINEIGRLPNGVELVRTKLTQQVVDELVRERR